MPRDNPACLPSTSTRNKYFSFQPMAVRGCRGGGGFHSIALPPWTSTGPPPIAVVTPVKSGELAVEIFNSMPGVILDRKSTRLNSSHTVISYAVFCLKKKNKKET